MSTAGGSEARTGAYEMYSEATRLHREGDLEQAATAYEEVIAEFGDSTDSYLRELVVPSVSYRASIRMRHPEVDAGRPLDLTAQMDRTENAELRERLARALAVESAVLMVRGFEDGAVALGLSLAAAVRAADNADVCANAATALQNAVEVLNGQGRHAQAEAALRDLAVQFGASLLATYDQAISDEDGADRDTRIGIRFRRAELLRAMEREEEARAGYVAVISEFGDDAEVQPVIDRARAALASGPQ